jgi:nucleoside-diphosphate-sugar epimerase
MKNQMVLITGANGLIGQEILKQLVDQKFENLRALDINNPGLKNKTISYCNGDINNPPEYIFKDVDIVIHLASVIGVNHAEDHPIQTIETIVNGTKKILDLSVKYGVSRFIMASSSEVYGDNYREPVNEKSPVSPKSAYGSAKLTAEYLCKAYKREHDLDYTIVRVFNAFGKNQSSNFVIPIFIEKALRSETIEVFGTGTQVRSFCHVSDVARCVIKIMDAHSTFNNTYNVGDARNPINIYNLALHIIKLVGHSKSKIKLVPYNSMGSREAIREIYFRVPDISSITEAVGYQPTADFTERLLEIIADKNEKISTGKIEKAG